jgi:hypothetical protein
MNPTIPGSETSTEGSKAVPGSSRTDKDAVSLSEETGPVEAGGTQAPSKVPVPKSIFVTSVGSASVGPDLEARISSRTDALSSSSVGPLLESAKFTEKRPVHTETLPPDVPTLEIAQRDIAIQVQEVFDAATGEMFEDSKESAFAGKIRALVRTRGVEAVRLIANSILSSRTRPDIAGVALRAIGELQDPQTREERRLLLEKALFAQSPHIRDGAISGLSAMRDRRSLGWLAKALEREEIDDLRDALSRLIERLQTDR